MSGEPSYLELGVPDVAAASRFYGRLLGWSLPETGGQVDTPSLDVGVHGSDPERHFQVFFDVEDVAASRAVLADLGGEVIGDVHDEGSFGRFIECKDDQGVRFGLRSRP